MSMDEIVTTSGAMEAVNLCLRAVARPGDTIAIESPTYYGVLQAIEGLGMKALEIPTHPRDGISLEALEFAIKRNQVKACVLIPNFNNPLGSCMPEANKKQLVEMLARREPPAAPAGPRTVGIGDTDAGDAAELLKITVWFAPACFIMLSVLWYFFFRRGWISGAVFALLVLLNFPIAALGVFALTGVLTSLNPDAAPSSSERRGPVPVTATGADFATTTRVDLTVTPGVPGPNTFEAEVTGFDDGRPVDALHIHSYAEEEVSRKVVTILFAAAL